MTADALSKLPIGTRLTWVYGENSYEKRHPAQIVEHSRGQVHLLVYFTDKPQQKKRWSLMTNQPVHESRGHVRVVKLEKAT